MASAENASAERDPAERPLVFIFNGDADGIVAQHSLGLEIGAPDARITGRKRDIDLLRSAPPMERGNLHVLDVSLRRNLDVLMALLPVMDKGGLGVGPQSHALDHSGRNGDHILQCAADLDADDVVAAIHAKEASAKLVLHQRDGSRVSGRHNDCRGHALGHL